MKHLVAIMTVFLLIGCQTTNSTPNALEPESKPVEKVEEKKENKTVEKPRVKEEETVGQVVMSHKPVICGDIQDIHKNLKETAREIPFAMWKDATYGHMVMMFVNPISKAVSLMEYPPNMGNLTCFISSGEDLQILQKLGTKTGHNIHYVP